jgi:hypothetical protein
MRTTRSRTSSWGEGGGDEARRVESLAALEHRLGPQRGLAV